MSASPGPPTVVGLVVVERAYYGLFDMERHIEAGLAALQAKGLVELQDGIAQDRDTR
jgi:hypothetical protein